MLAASLVLGLAVSRLSLAASFVVALMLIGAFVGTAQIAIARHGIWQASALPSVAVVLTFIALSLYRYGLLDKERRHMRPGVFGATSRRRWSIASFATRRCPSSAASCAS